MKELVEILAAIVGIAVVALYVRKFGFWSGRRLHKSEIQTLFQGNTKD
jgi:hypothetical protein